MTLRFAVGKRMRGAMIAIVGIPFLAACQSRPFESNPLPVEVEATSHAVHLEIGFQTPTPAWTLTPVAVYQVGSEHWCFFQLTPPEGMVAQVISTVSCAFGFESESTDLPAKHFVLGKTWSWDSNPEITFIDSMDSLKDALADAEELALIVE